MNNPCSEGEEMEGSILCYLARRHARAEVESYKITALSVTEMPTRG